MRAAHGSASFAVEYFCCFVPLLFGGVAALAVWARRNGATWVFTSRLPMSAPQNRPASRPQPPKPDPGPVGFELLRAADPGFDEADFYDRVSWMVSKVHHAVTDQDFERVRSFVDDTALSALRRRIDLMHANRWREVFRYLRVERLTACTVERSGSVETVRLGVTISTAYAVIDEISGRYVRGRGDPEVVRSMHEYWTIFRQVDPDPAPRPVITSCPTCGGPIAEGHRWACEYCGTDLRGPEREWTVLAIEFDEMP